jgi:hypothetical protein
MSPRRGSKPRRTDRLVVGRNVTLTMTLTLSSVEYSECMSEVAVFKEELQSYRLVLKVNGPSGIGRQATSEDTVRRLGKCYSEHSEL